MHIRWHAHCRWTFSIAAQEMELFWHIHQISTIFLCHQWLPVLQTSICNTLSVYLSFSGCTSRWLVPFHTTQVLLAAQHSDYFYQNIRWVIPITHIILLLLVKTLDLSTHSSRVDHVLWQGINYRTWFPTGNLYLTEETIIHFLMHPLPYIYLPNMSINRLQIHPAVNPRGHLRWCLAEDL